MTRLALVPLLLAVTAVGAAPAAAAVNKSPSLSARNAIVIETTTGSVAFSRGADERRPIASATKLMTALLALETLELSDTVRAARYHALPIESKIGLRAGEQMSVADLLRGLLITSANDAAVTLAERIGHTRKGFVSMMNARAVALGLRNTHYANPVGLDAPGAYSTARDLATLALELRKHTFFRKTVDRPSATLKTGARPRTFANRNLLVRRVPWVDGVKTGHTQGAGWVLVGSGTRRDVSLVSVVLGTPSEAARQADTLALLRYGLSRFRFATAVRRGRVLARTPIRFRGGAELELMAGRTVKRVIRRGKTFSLRVKDVPVEVEGPIREGQRMGVVEVRRGEELLTTVGLVATSDVPAASLTRKTTEYATRPWGIVAAAIGATVLIALVRRRVTRARGGRHEVRAA